MEPEENPILSFRRIDFHFHNHSIVDNAISYSARGSSEIWTKIYNTRMGSVVTFIWFIEYMHQLYYLYKERVDFRFIYGQLFNHM